jgi:hypothetical protein
LTSLRTLLLPRCLVCLPRFAQIVDLLLRGGQQRRAQAGRGERVQAASTRRPNLLQFVALLERELQLVLRVVQLLPPLLGLALAC